ncbi:MAG TPA: hypothetical protein VG274_12260 [Rhizomicrobium sp.]|nr:hypothetical protein [Rhizomicrobium sp.]
MSASRDEGDARANALDHALAPMLPVLLMAAALLCVAGVARAIAVLPLHVSLDPNEGWNAYHAAAAIAGHGLYPSAAGLMANNYPPLSFYLVGALGRLLGDHIIAGRVISLASFLCCSWFIAIAIGRMKGAWQASTFAPLLFAGILLVTSDYVGMDDPELFGHALQLAALLFLLREPRGASAIFASACLFVAGGFVKHNLFALPLAAQIWLALYDRRNALRFAVWIAALSVAGLLAFRVTFGFDLLDRLNSARAYSVAQLRGNISSWLEVGLIPGCALLGLTIWRKRDRFVALLALYAVMSVAAGAWLLGGAGVDVNAMFDADIALALGAGLALEMLTRRRDPLPHIASRALAFFCLLPLAMLAFTVSDWRDPAYWLHPMRDESALASDGIAFLRNHRGPAMCENLTLCYWAGKPAEVDMFNLDQQFVTHARKPAPFISLLDARHFSAIELDETDPFPLPPGAQDAIRRNYRIDHVNDEGVFFLPK